MDLSLRQRVALVTGSSQGIGRVFASAVLKWEVAGLFGVKNPGVKFKMHHILGFRPFSAPTKPTAFESLGEFNRDREKSFSRPSLQLFSAPFLKQFIYLGGIQRSIEITYRIIKLCHGPFESIHGRDFFSLALCVPQHVMALPCSQFFNSCLCF